MQKPQLFSYVRRLFSSKQPHKTKICIVGAGPAGFYAAQHLAKKLDQSQIDIYERLPVPFGLVRFGVAPDHPDVKNVIHTFTKTAHNPNVRFIGNVNLGSDIRLDELKKSYHVVLLTYGADENHLLNVPGENLQNVIPARKIVGWYNGVPWDSQLKIDLSGETAAIFGQGNVAIDVARILLTPIEELRKTDITQFALEQISNSKLKKIYLIGRRGPLQAAFTIKELREMLKLHGCSTVWRNTDFQGVAEHVPKLARPRKRITELMLKSVEEQNIAKDKIFSPLFMRSPLEFMGEDKVKGVILGVNQLEGEDILNKTAVLTKTRETIECDLAISSIGYKSIQADDSLPFDSSRGIVKNTNSKVDKGLYVSGWLVAELIINDIEKEHLNTESKPGFQEIKKILDGKNIQVVDWAGWEKIDRYEVKEGEKVGKPREKIIDIKKMLDVAT